jgi:hypothetical protein
MMSRRLSRKSFFDVLTRGDDRINTVEGHVSCGRGCISQSDGNVRQNDRDRYWNFSRRTCSTSDVNSRDGGMCKRERHPTRCNGGVNCFDDDVRYFDGDLKHFTR